jgi:maleylacetate reductase
MGADVTAGGIWRHVEQGRTIVFGRGALGSAATELGEGYALLTTKRTLAGQETLAERAQATVLVPPGRVDDVAAHLRPSVAANRLLALGGGRVIDVAKARAAADPPRTVAAIPTTLSGAEMTGLHRHAHGVDSATPRVRPALVVNDPELSASQPPAELASSAANALGHAFEALVTTRSSALSTVAAFEAARLIAGAFHPEPDRDALALASLLAGWAIDHAGLGLHHVLAQTVVRMTDRAHAAVNAALLPATIVALERRAPAAFGALGERIGERPNELAIRLRYLAGTGGLLQLGADREALTQAATLAAQQPELRRTPPAADAAELASILRAAY